MNEIGCESYVYIMESCGFIKIGATSELNRRISSMKTHNPNDVSLIGSFRYEKRQHSFFIEWKIHERLKISNKHHRYEWFIHDDESLYIINSVIKEFNIEILEKANNMNKSFLSLRDIIISEQGINRSQVSRFLKENNMPIASNIISNGEIAGFNIPEKGSDEICLNYIIEKLSKYLEAKENAK